MDPEVKVVKFGGSIVGSGARLAEAAERVVRSPAGFTVVVASAPGDLTDLTLGVLSESELDATSPEAARVLGRAEILGAELMASALRARGVRVRLLVPDEPDWPVVLQRAGVDAPIDLEATRERFRILRARSPAGTVVVMPGFVGVAPDGRPGTLPRGGGDTTAVVAGRSLDAREVFLVKDVAGVHARDPRVDPSAPPLRELTRDAMELLARAGANVVALDALRYLPPDLGLRVIGLGAPFDASTGTLIRESPTASPQRGSLDPAGTPAVVELTPEAGR